MPHQIMRGGVSRCKKPLTFGRKAAIVLGMKKGKKKVDEVSRASVNRSTPSGSDKDASAMKKVLILAAVGEGATGLALLIVPSLVAKLLLGAELAGVAVIVARVAGIALISLSVACWPGTPLIGMLIYSAAITLYFALHRLRGRFRRNTAVAGGHRARDPDGTFGAGINKRQGDEYIEEIDWITNPREIERSHS